MVFILVMMTAPVGKMCLEFRKGQKVDLGESGWKVMFVIASGILDLLKKVVNSNQIILQSVINDPSYD
jgi:hypothetical protein